MITHPKSVFCGGIWRSRILRSYYRSGKGSWSIDTKTKRVVPKIPEEVVSTDARLTTAALPDPGGYTYNPAVGVLAEVIVPSLTA